MKSKDVLSISCAIGLLTVISARKAEGVEGYVIPADGQYEAALSAVNLLLEENIPVYQLAQSFQVGGNTFSVGDYIVSLPFVPFTSNDNIAREFALDVMDQYCLTKYALPSSFSTSAYKLKDTNVTVYAGGGTSAGAIWHITPAERVLFDVDIVWETDVQGGDFAGGNVITFPSGGFYSSYLGTTGGDEIKDFVADGNGFVGTCGGNVYGVELGLLDVDLGLDGEWPAAADYRGPIKLTNEAPNHPIMSTVGSSWTPHYWIGQHFARVGSSVTTLALYDDFTQDLEVYGPTLYAAFGFAPILDVIDDFWDNAAAVTGTYTSGKVTLMGPHPEKDLGTQPFFLSAIQHMTTSGPYTLTHYNLPHLSSIRQYSSGSTTWSPSTATIASRLAQAESLSVAARAHFNGLEDDNHDMVNGPGEFVITWLDDQIDRLDQLGSDVYTLAALFDELDELDDDVVANQYCIATSLYQTARNRIAAAKALIAAAMNLLGTVDTQYDEIEAIEDAMAAHKQDLLDLQALRASEGETPEFYTGVIDLYFAEGATDDLLQYGPAYFTLKASFAANKALANARSTKRLVNAILEVSGVL